MNILVIGIGQTLRGDDAIGLEAVRLWQEKNPQTASLVQVEFSELPGLELLDRLKGMDVAILVDAVHSSANPGSLLRMGMDELAAFDARSQSVHGWGVAETLALGISLQPELRRCRLTVIGIVGDCFDLDASFSPAVQAALPQASEMIENEIQAVLK